MMNRTDDARQDVDQTTTCTTIFDKLWLRFGVETETPTTIRLSQEDDLVTALQRADFHDYKARGIDVGDSSVLIRTFADRHYNDVFVDAGDGTNAEMLQALRASAVAILRAAGELERLMKAVS